MAQEPNNQQGSNTNKSEIVNQEGLDDAISKVSLDNSLVDEQAINELSETISNSTNQGNENTSNQNNNKENQVNKNKVQNINSSNNKQTPIQNIQKAKNSPQNQNSLQGIEDISQYIQNKKTQDQPITNSFDQVTALDGTDLTSLPGIYAVVPHKKGDHKLVFFRDDAPKELLEDSKGRKKGAQYEKNGKKVYDINVDFKTHPTLKRRDGKNIDVWIIDDEQDLHHQLQSIQNGAGGGTNFGSPILSSQPKKDTSSKIQIDSKEVKQESIADNKKDPIENPTQNEDKKSEDTSKHDNASDKQTIDKDKQTDYKDKQITDNKTNDNKTDEKQEYKSKLDGDENFPIPMKKMKAPTNESILSNSGFGENEKGENQDGEEISIKENLKELDTNEKDNEEVLQNNDKTTIEENNNENIEDVTGETEDENTYENNEEKFKSEIPETSIDFMLDIGDIIPENPLNSDNSGEKQETESPLIEQDAEVAIEPTPEQITNDERSPKIDSGTNEVESPKIDSISNEVESSNQEKSSDTDLSANIDSKPADENINVPETAIEQKSPSDTDLPAQDSSENDQSESSKNTQDTNQQTAVTQSDQDRGGFRKPYVEPKPVIDETITMKREGFGSSRNATNQQASPQIEENNDQNANSSNNLEGELQNSNNIQETVNSNEQEEVDTISQPLIDIDSLSPQNNEISQQNTQQNQESVEVMPVEEIAEIPVEQEGIIDLDSINIDTPPATPPIDASNKAATAVAEANAKFHKTKKVKPLGLIIRIVGFIFLMLLILVILKVAFPGSSNQGPEEIVPPAAVINGEEDTNIIGGNGGVGVDPIDEGNTDTGGSSNDGGGTGEPEKIIEPPVVVDPIEGGGIYTLEEIKAKLETQQIEARRLLNQAKLLENKEAIKFATAALLKASKAISLIEKDPSITADEMDNDSIRIDDYIKRVDALIGG